MISTTILLLMSVSGSLSNTDVFGPDRILQRDGYMVGHKTYQYGASSQHARYARAAALGYRTDFSQREITEIVEHHNTLRTRVNPSASNIQYMEWDEQLADMAQQWAENCDFQHGQVQNLSPYNVVGQNLFVGSGDTRFRSGVYATQEWFDEEQWYTYSSNSCVPGEMCGHYTQVVWASTNKVGCGRHQCSRVGGFWATNAYLIVCNYGPAGNFRGEKPYSVGPACTQCPSDKPRCYQDLCHNCSSSDRDCGCDLHCENCGTLDENHCSCNCINGWMGSFCSIPCEDKHEWCGANPGWSDSSSCHSYDYVPSLCPKLCGLCSNCNPADETAKCDRNKPEKPKKNPSKPKKPKTDKPKSTKPPYCTTIPFAVAVIDNELVMFKKGKMWRFSSSGKLLSKANGDNVQISYPGVANGFKAVYQRQHDNRVVFLRGADFYIFNGNTLESGPTKLKSVGLKGNPSATFYHRGERKSYYFKGSSVWRFDDRRQRVDPGFPKPISEVFQGVPAKITGAFQDANASQPMMLLSNFGVNRIKNVEEANCKKKKKKRQEKSDLIFVLGKGYYKIRQGTTQVNGGRKLFHRDMLEGC